MALTGEISPCCLSGQLKVGTPKGRDETIGGVPTYTSAPPSRSKAKSVIFLGDLFGYKLPNIRLLADEYAKAGLYIYVPDILFGDYVDCSFLQNAEPSLAERAEHNSLLDRGIRGAKVAATMSPWLLRHRESVTKPIVDGFISAVKNIPGTEKVGVAGFCWGGRFGTLAAHAHNKVQVHAVMIFHPSVISVPGDFKDVAVPFGMAIGDKGSVVSLKDVAKIKATLGKKSGLPTHIRIYEDQVHGFALREDWSSGKDKEAMDNAARQGVEWFNKYLST